MTHLTEKEATLLMHSYGMKCDVKKVKQWLKEGTLKGIENDGDYSIAEDEVYSFLEAYRWEGTAYEEGIDDKTKINRLLEEIANLKQKVSELEKEKEQFKNQLEIMPF